LDIFRQVLPSNVYAFLIFPVQRHCHGTADYFKTNEQAICPFIVYPEFLTRALQFQFKRPIPSKVYVCGCNATQAYAEVYQTETKPYGGN